MAFIVKGDREKVRERVNSIIDGIEKQGRFNFQLYVREVEDAQWEGILQLKFHTKAYPSHYPNPKPKNPNRNQ